MFISLLFIATSSLAASDAVRVGGDLKVDGIHFSKDGSTINSSNDLLKNTGGWSSVNVYSAGDVVQSQGISYVAATANQNSLPPNVNWSVLAAQGIKGDKGDTGTPACNSTKWVMTSQSEAWEYNSTVRARNRTFVYDTTGKLIGSIYLSDFSDRLLTCSSYDTNSNPISCKYYVGNYKVVNYTVSYTYGVSNNILSKVELAKDSIGNFEWSTVYNYDANGNLISEVAYEDMANPNLITDTATYTNIFDTNGKAVQATVSHTDQLYSSDVVLYQYTKICL